MTGARNWALIMALVVGLATAARNLPASEPGASEKQPAKKSMTTISCDDVRIALAPYVWKCTGSGATARAEATLPGAYLKLAFQNSSTLGLLVDGTANIKCPSSGMPVVDYSVDDGPFKTIQLTNTGEVYALPLAQGLEAGKQHRVEFYFRAASFNVDRWAGATGHLRIAGVQLDEGTSLVAPRQRTKKAIAFGDSITEGVNVEGSVPFYSNLLMNNARCTWFPIVSAALDCEYGQLGTGGQGMIRTNTPMPPLPQTWDHYDSATSRLTNGLLTPQPDYVYCAMGTNDFEEKQKRLKHMDITMAYTQWLASVRKSCPKAIIFCITPPLGWHAPEIQAAVTARKTAGDQEVHLIDTAPLKAGFRAADTATSLAGDGVHPTLYGNAMLGAFIAVEAQKVLSRTH